MMNYNGSVDKAVNHIVGLYEEVFTYSINSGMLIGERDIANIVKNLVANGLSVPEAVEGYIRPLARTQTPERDALYFEIAKRFEKQPFGEGIEALEQATLIHFKKIHPEEYSLVA